LRKLSSKVSLTLASYKTSCVVCCMLTTRNDVGKLSALKMLRAKTYSIKYVFVSLGKRASNGCVFSVLSFNGLALSPNVYSLLLDNPPTCGSWHAVRRYVCVQVCLSPWKQWVVFIPCLVHCQQHDLSRYKMRKFYSH